MKNSLGVRRIAAFYTLYDNVHLHIDAKRTYHEYSNSGCTLGNDNLYSINRHFGDLLETTNNRYYKSNLLHAVS